MELTGVSVVTVVEKVSALLLLLLLSVAAEQTDGND